MDYPEIPVTLYLQEAPHRYWLALEAGHYLIRDAEGNCQGTIARSLDGSWYRTGGIRFPAQSVEQMGQAIDDFEFVAEHSFGFGWRLRVNCCIVRCCWVNTATAFI